MRSNLVRAAFAALLLSSSLGLASANASSMAPGEQTTRTDQIEEALPPQPAAPMVHAMAAPRYAQAMRPRLHQIVHELNRADHRIRVDSRHGYLTASERNQVRREAGEIRREAHATANRHNGAIPHAQFVRYQRDIRDLGRTIHRLSTNGAVA